MQLLAMLAPTPPYLPPLLEFRSLTTTWKAGTRQPCTERHGVRVLDAAAAAVPLARCLAACCALTCTTSPTTALTSSLALLPMLSRS